MKQDESVGNHQKMEHQFKRDDILYTTTTTHNNNNNNNNNNNTNNNNNKNNKNGNFIWVFECTIVNLATYRQMLLEIGLFKKNRTKQKQKKDKKRKDIKIALSLGYPNSYFCNKRCNMLL